jgi:putative membrane protein
MESSIHFHHHAHTTSLIALATVCAAFVFLYLWAALRQIPANAGYSAEDIEYAAKLMYYGGDIAELIVAAILFAVILRSRPATQEVLH